MIGDVHYVRAFWYRNSLPNDPAWRYVIPPEATPQNTDWNKFLGNAPKHAWDPQRYFQWRLYWDYSGGISTDPLGHQTDIVNFLLSKTVPLLGTEKPIAPPPVGQQAAISGHMATLSFKNNKKVIWDEAANKYHFV